MPDINFHILKTAKLFESHLHSSQLHLFVMLCLDGLTIVPYCVLELVKQECFKPISTYKRSVSLVCPYAPLIAAF